MRLNPDCIRDIMLTAEETITPKKVMFCYFDDHYERLEKYTYSEIKFHAHQCELSKLIIVTRFIDDGFYISDITPAGYTFLDKIRSDNVWNKVKTSLMNLGSLTIKIIVDKVLNTALSDLA